MYPRDQIKSVLVIFMFVNAFVPACLLIVLGPYPAVNAGKVAQSQTRVAYLAHVGGFVFGVMHANAARGVHWRVWGDRDSGWAVKNTHCWHWASQSGIRSCS